jgi:hypothetical protein
MHWAVASANLAAVSSMWRCRSHGVTRPWMGDRVAKGFVGVFIVHMGSKVRPISSETFIDPTSEFRALPHAVPVPVRMSAQVEFELAEFLWLLFTVAAVAHTDAHTRAHVHEQAPRSRRWAWGSYPRCFTVSCGLGVWFGIPGALLAVGAVAAKLPEP